MGKKGLHKSIQIYFSKLKIPSLHLQNHVDSSSCLLSACKYPRTPSFTVDRNPPNGHDHPAALPDVDSFLFNSLYTRDEDSDGYSYESPSYADPLPKGIRASQRFFVSTGASNSLVDDARLSAASTSSAPFYVDKVVPTFSEPVVTFSKDPYDDFRRTMQDMVDARHVDPREPLDWDFMEELLFCYLELNDRSVHKYILGAFTDLVVSFRDRIHACQRKIPVTAERRRRRRRRRRMKEREGFMV